MPWNRAGMCNVYFGLNIFYKIGSEIKLTFFDDTQPYPEDTFDHSC